MRAIDAILQLLADHRVRYIFGNPGTSELPLNDALVGDDRFRYILGLQEIPVMGIADGFAMASGSLAVVNLHISCGVGNAMGLLYNAYREGTPLLVTAGQQDRRLMFEEPILFGDMVSVVRPWTKWAYELQRAADVPTAIRRAVQAALTPPTGPVFLSLPMDLQVELLNEPDLTPISLPDSRVRPSRDALDQAASLLAKAKQPAILAGSRVTERQANEQLAAIAETLGAAVITEPGTTLGRLPLRSNHPLYAGSLPLWSPQIRQRLQPFDTLLVVGMDLLRQYVYHEPARAIPEHVRLVHLDESPWQLHKNYPLQAALIGDTREGLRELNQCLIDRIDATFQADARRRREKISRQQQDNRRELQRQIDAEPASNPMSSLQLMNCVAKTLPSNAAVVEAAVTTTRTVLHQLGALKNHEGYFAHRGWTLGWGLNVTTGVQLAWPDRPVLGLIGDGAAMYGIQGLWTAARYRIPAIYLICNNSQYQILKVGAKGLELPRALQDQFLGLDLQQPEINFVGLAKSLGIEAVRISQPDELEGLLESSWHRITPLLIDVPIDRNVPDALGY